MNTLEWIIAEPMVVEVVEDEVDVVLVVVVDDDLARKCLGSVVGSLVLA